MVNLFDVTSGWLQTVPPAVLDDIAQAANALALRHWGPPGSGSCSVRLPPRTAASRGAQAANVQSQALALPFESLGGRSLALTRAGCRMEELASAPTDELCFVQLNATGDFMWVSGGPPAAELEVHLAMHAARCERSEGDCGILHLHPPCLTALSHLGQPGPALARTRSAPIEACSPPHFAGFLASLCPEAGAELAEAVTVLPPETPGSRTLARRSAEASRNYRLLVWPFHGVMAWGDDLKQALDLVLAAESAAEVGLRVLSCLREGSGPNAGE